jgi:hypothetical protein
MPKVQIPLLLVLLLMRKVGALQLRVAVLMQKDPLLVQVQVMLMQKEPILPQKANVLIAKATILKLVEILSMYRVNTTLLTQRRVIVQNLPIL